jgi:uncharacterized protein YjbI with pentapeptide repeats
MPDASYKHLDYLYEAHPTFWRQMQYGDMKRKNFILEAIKFSFCIIQRLGYQACIIRGMDIEGSDLHGVNVKDSTCQYAKVQDSDFSRGSWKGVDLSRTEMRDCKIDGLRINGYDIARLIKEKEAASLIRDGR